MILLKSFANIFKVPELRKRTLFTLGVLVIYRLGMFIPIVGVNIALLGQKLKMASGWGSLFSYLDTISGSAFSQCAIFSLGISPYITASIAMQLLAMSIPSLEQLQKEGEYGRRLINQYTRYLTLVIAFVSSLTYCSILQAAGLVLQPGIVFKLMFTISMTAGAMFVMWLGEQILTDGIGNGSSMLIFAGIVVRLPDLVLRTVGLVQMGTTSLLSVAIVLVLFVAIVACIIFLEKGERKIPIQYARRVVGNRVYGGQSSYIPFKVNPVGVMPVIFAGSAMMFPMLLVNFLTARFESLAFLRETFSQNGMVWDTVQFILIIFFTFLYTAMVFNPEELAENIKKNGGFIPGIRPGAKTARFFDYILNRIGLIGAIYLGFLAIVPSFIRMFFDVPFMLQGISLLIAVGVALELSAQVETYLIEHRYEGFLSSGRMRSRVAR